VRYFEETAGRSDSNKVAIAKAAASADWGLMRNGFQEFPFLTWSGTDVDSLIPHTVRTANVKPKADAFGIALRSGYSWVPRMLPEAPEPTYKGGQISNSAATAQMKTWLITGGAGGLGLLFARWLVLQGVPSLRLADVNVASLPSDLAGQAAALISACMTDIATSAGVSFATQSSSWAPPIGGVLHAAGVLKVGND
jgi:KR domain